MKIKLIHATTSDNVGNLYNVTGPSNLDAAIKFFEAEKKLKVFRKKCAEVDEKIAKAFGNRVKVGTYWIETLPSNAPYEK